MRNGWHEGTIGSPIGSRDNRIAHYWVKTAEEDQEAGMGRIVKLQIKIDGKTSFVIRNGKKTKEFWDGTITSDKKPLRLKIRNICGDESVWRFEND